MSSPNAQAASPARNRGSSPAAAIPSEPLPDNDIVEVDEHAESSDDADSVNTDTTSISSSIRRGIVENGRRYNSTRPGEYWGPSDDKAFESMNISHLVYQVLDCQQENPFFRAPVGENVQNILDIGTGDGAWAIDVADRYPGAKVIGVDLYPPPETFLPSNCELLVDDVVQPWIYDQKFELIHARFLLGSFTAEGWKALYKQIYDNLVPGGWFEAVEPSIHLLCDDGSLPADSKNAAWGPMFYKIGAEVTGRPMDMCYTMKDNILAAGFTNLQEKAYKIPVGTWPKHPIFKEAGRLYYKEVSAGLEGYAYQLLTKCGLPEPWSVEEVDAHLKGIREEWANKKYHLFTDSRRVWAQKPYDA